MNGAVLARAMALDDGLFVFFRLGHIVSAIVWLGLIYFMAFVRPRVFRGLSEDAQRQVMPQLSRYVGPWMMWSAIGTLAFGAALHVSLGRRIGFENVGMGLNIGIALAFLMFVLGIVFVVPVTRKSASVLKGGKPPGLPEIRRATYVGHLNAGLSFLVVFLMVSSQRIAFLS